MERGSGVGIGGRLALLGVLLLLWGAGAEAAPRVRDEQALRQAADRTVRAFAARDGVALAALAQPGGVRFSPCSTVDPKGDRVVSPRRLKGFWQEKKVLLWGTEEGSGEPIRLTPGQYVRRYVLDRDYRGAGKVTVGENRSLGSNRNNVPEVYPQGVAVEYFVPPAEEGGLDWSALRLVFRLDGGTWLLAGVIHDRWSP